MNKKVLAITILILVTFLTVLLFLNFSPSTEPPIPNGIPNNISNGSPPTGTFSQIDFTTQDGVVNQGNGLYSLEEKLYLEARGFSILYSENNNSYIISITKLPLAVYRNNAEDYFLDLLKIDKESACKMNIYVGTPASVSNAHSGRNLGLSFCPGNERI